MLKNRSLVVDPADYDDARLSSERVALVRAISDEPFEVNNITHFYMELEKGAHYLMVFKAYWFLSPEGEDNKLRFVLIGEDERPGSSAPAKFFEVVSDPLKLTTSKIHPDIRRNDWRIARSARLDKSKNMVSDDYLVKNRLALIIGANKDHKDTFGKQYLAYTHVPDLSAAAYVKIIRNDHIRGEQFADFDILSDPLGVLDFTKTDWKENEERFKKLRPELFP